MQNLVQKMNLLLAKCNADKINYFDIMIDLIEAQFFGNKQSSILDKILLNYFLADFQGDLEDNNSKEQLLYLRRLRWFLYTKRLLK